MSSRLSEDVREQATPLLEPLARMVAQGGEPGERAVAILLMGADLDQDPAVAVEVRRWAGLLAQARRDPSMREVVIEALRLRGVPQAPAQLAVATATEATRDDSGGLSAHPASVDFGTVAVGATAAVQVEVRGGPGIIEVDSDRVRTSLGRFGTEPTVLRVEAALPAEGMLWTSLRLRGDGHTLDIPVTGSWAPAAHATPVVSPAGRATPIISSKGPAPLVVSPTGPADQSTIRAAVEAAPPGSRILIRPGLYREGIILDKPLEIIGDGPRDQIIIETDGADCIWMRADHAVVRGLALRNRTASGETGFNNVDAATGRLVLEDCDLTCTDGSCIYVHGVNTSATIRGCHIHDGHLIGVRIVEQARGVIEDCDIHGNAQAGLAFWSAGEVTMRHCRSHDNETGGVYVSEHGVATLEDCDIYRNGAGGISATAGGSLVVRRSQIHDNEHSGVVLWDQAQGTIETLKYCDIYSNKYAGVHLKGQNTVATLRGNLINRNGYEAVWVEDGAGATVEDNDLTGNQRGPWDIGSSSRAHVHAKRNQETKPHLLRQGRE